MGNFSIANMSLEEKLQAMELLWDDLCRHDGDVTSPAWHGDVLADRDAAIARGDAKFEDWETAKARIQKEIG